MEEADVELSRGRPFWRKAFQKTKCGSLDGRGKKAKSIQIGDITGRMVGGLFEKEAWGVADKVVPSGCYKDFLLQGFCSDGHGKTL